MNVVVVGRGSLGSALARGLRRRADPSVSVSVLRGRGDGRAGCALGPSERARLARADVVVLAVPDPAIAEVAARVGPALRRGSVALHAAGARTVAELDVLVPRGVHVGVLHPMVSFAAGARALVFEGTTFVGGGSRRAVSAARRLSRALGARFVEAQVHGPAYHAAAALVANGSVALAWAAVELLVAQGLARGDAERALAGLLGTVATNVGDVGVPAALTGPIARGDAAAVRAHRRAIAEVPAAAGAYDRIAPSILACARARGLDAVAAAAVAAALEAAATPGERITPPRQARAARAPADDRPAGARAPRPRRAP